MSHHLGLAAGLTRAFLGREEELARLEAALDPDKTDRLGLPNRPVFLLGPAGVGKSALLAEAGVRAKLRAPEAVVVFRFVGAAPGAANPRLLLDGVCRQLAAVFGGGGGAAAAARGMPADLPGLREELVRWMGRASAGSPVLVLVDGVDELELAGGATPSFDWLPATLPRHSGLLCSLQAASEACGAALNRRFGGDALHAVQALSGAQGAALLERLLAQQGRASFAAGHFERIRDGAQESAGLDGGGRNCSPLYVELALGLAAGWPSSEPAPALPRTAAGLADHLLVGLAEAHGRLLAERAFGLLLTARDGLAWAELVDVLSCDDAVVDEAYGPRSPAVRRLPAVTGRLFARDAERLLGRAYVGGGGEALRAAHRHVRLAAEQRWGLDRAPVRALYHGALAAYFSGQWAAGKALGGWDAPEAAGGGAASAAAAVLFDRGLHPQPLFFTGRSECFAHRRAGRPNARRVREMPFHICWTSGRFSAADPVLRAAEPAAAGAAGRAERRAQARFEAHVCRLEFVEAACAVGLGPELAEDLLVARSVFRESGPVRQFYRFVAGNAADLARRSGLTLQQALNAAGRQEALNAAAEALVAGGVVRRRGADGWAPPAGWFVHTNKEEFVDPRRGGLAGHYGGVFGAAASERDDIAVTCGADGVARVHDLQARREVRRRGSGRAIGREGRARRRSARGLRCEAAAAVVRTRTLLGPGFEAYSRQAAITACRAQAVVASTQSTMVLRFVTAVAAAAVLAAAAAVAAAGPKRR